jgi:hypothetical protein
MTDGNRRRRQANLFFVSYRVPFVIRRALEKKSMRGPMNLPTPSQVVEMLGRSVY